MTEALTRILTGGTLASGVAMMLSAVVPAATAPTGESSSALVNMTNNRPELAAILIALSMFLGYLTLLMKDRKADRDAAATAQKECHNTSLALHDKVSDITARCMVAIETTASDRDALQKVVEENTESNNELRKALRQSGGMGS